MASRFRAAPFLAAVLCSIPALLPAGAPQAEAAGRRGAEPRATPRLPASPPVWFEPNRGQAPDGVRMLARAAGYVALLTDDGAVVRGAGGDFRLRIAGAAGEVVPQDPLPGRSHYFVGDDPSKWVRNVPQHGGAVLDEARPGVDIRWTGDGRDLRFDVECERASDAAALRISLDGADRASIDATGRIVIDVRGARTDISAPVAWQSRSGRRVPVDVRWASHGDGAFGFALGAHDAAAPLVIDPVIHASTYLGSSGADGARGIATDATGALYLCGSTASSAFPAQPTTGAGTVFQTTYGEPVGSPNYGTWTDGFVAKLTGNGQTILWATYIGGGGIDVANDIELDANGDVLVCGATAATNFPTTASPYLTTGAGFAARVQADGTALLVSTYLTRAARRIASDASGNVIVLSDLSPAQVLKFDSAIATNAWTNTYTPTSGSLIGMGMALDTSGNVWVAGYTGNNAAVPTTGSHYNRTYNGGTNDGLIWRCTAATGARTLETYFGGSGDDRCEDVVVEATGSVHICGTTTSTNIPLAAALQTTNRGGTDGFVAKFATNGTALLWSTYFGGTATDTPRSIVLNSASDVFLAGETTSTTSFQILNALQAVHGGGTNDGFVAKLTAGGVLRWSTYFGGSGSDTCAAVTVGPTGRPACAGQTASTNFPTGLSPVQGTNNGAGDAYVFVAEESTQPFGDVSFHDLGGVGSLGDATEQINYNFPAQTVLPLSGGRIPLAWSQNSGSIPAGMTLSASGVLTGAPNVGSQGSYRFTVRVIDADGAVVTREYGITVFGPPVVVTTQLPDWTVGEVLNMTFQSTGGRPPLTWYLKDATAGGTGRLPNDASGNPISFLATGGIGGRVGEAGDFSFGVELRDAGGASGLGTIAIHVNERPALNDVDFSPWTEGRPYSRTFSGGKGTPPYRWTLASGTLPVTGTVNLSSGRISGNVQPAGDYAFTIQMEDANGARETRAFSMHSNPVPTVTTESLPLGLVQRAYGARLTSTGGTGAHVWFFTGGGSVPVGFELDGFTGTMNGTPLLGKPFDFEVRVVDEAGAAGTKFLRLDVVPFFSLAAKKNAVQDAFGPDANTGEVRRFIELLAGSRLDGTVRLIGKGKIGAHLRLVDTDTGEEVDLRPYTKTKGAKSTIKKFVVGTTRRFYMIVEPDAGFEGTVETSLKATPQLAWSGRVSVDPVGSPAAVTVEALGGSFLTVTAKKAKKSAALPTIASVIDSKGNDLFDAFEMKVTKTGVVLKMTKPVPLGTVTISFAGRPEGGIGNADWTVALKSPKEYDAQFYDRPAVTPDEP